MTSRRRGQGKDVPAGGLHDLLVIGGGINGAGIARDAAGRGLIVMLCEKGDLAQGTSSASTKLIHGGLRYLEHYEFRLVRESLIEREVLLRAAPHIIRPMRFVLPHDTGQRPAWMIRMGLWLYDHLGRRGILPGCESLDLERHAAGQPIRRGFRRGFAYSDCWVEDSRLVVLNAMDAKVRGAAIHTRTELVSARRTDGCWKAVLRDMRSGAERSVRARALVNATGPWVSEVLDRRLRQTDKHRLRLVKGSHIVVPRVYEGDHAYIFQIPDGRVVFAIPYEERFTLIGTTEVDVADADVTRDITPGETAYLCAAVNRYFEAEVSPGDVVWSYAGVRPLFDDQAGSASSATRDYVLDLDGAGGEAPLLNVLGGKLTTYRRLAERALEKLAPALGMTAGTWTARTALPGGDIADADFDAFLAAFRARHAWLDARLALRYARSYGTRAEVIVGDASGTSGLGEHFGDGLYEAEIGYLLREEFAETAEDILWRRSKMGLHVSAETAARLETRLGAGRTMGAERAAAP